MGLFDKIKDIFYDEEEIEEVEERPKIEKNKIEKPRIEEVHISEVKENSVDNYNERNIFKTETKPFKFPIIDEEEAPKKVREAPKDYEQYGLRQDERPLSRMRTYEEERPVKRDIHFDRYERPVQKEQKQETRVFRPSPVISPVYGILDKNYTKEEVQVKKGVTISRNNEEVDFDSIRRKAYGTLEEEIEKNIENIKDEETTKDNKSIEDLLSEIEVNKNISIGELEERVKNDIEKEDELDKTLENDLFNLIDSMYDKEDE